jgi:hypothetical protein
MSEIEWTRHSTKEWIGETEEDFEYRINEVAYYGPTGFNGLDRGVKKRHMTAWFCSGGYSVTRIGLPDEGPGVMDRLRKLCEQHYQDYRSGETDRLWTQHQQADPPRQWVEPREDL